MDATQFHVCEDDVNPWIKSACLVAVGEPHVVAEWMLVITEEELKRLCPFQFDPGVALKW